MDVQSHLERMVELSRRLISDPDLQPALDLQHLSNYVQGYELLDLDSLSMMKRLKESEKLKIIAEDLHRTAANAKAVASHNINKLIEALLGKDVVDLVSVEDSPILFELDQAGWKGQVRIVPLIAPDVFDMTTEERIAMIHMLIQNGFNVHPETLASLPLPLRLTDAFALLYDGAFTVSPDVRAGYGESAAGSGEPAAHPDVRAGYGEPAGAGAGAGARASGDAGAVAGAVAGTGTGAVA